uniref:CGG triplet repeat-binding protein 1-like n=1 Tax=Jaculus jaculus TaxID=51337 RepID=UPI001E1B4F29|nr:CGG triplet repeat-binding protein 1-like [Jaculus jaculus]
MVAFSLQEVSGHAGRGGSLESGGGPASPSPWAETRSPDSAKSLEISTAVARDRSRIPSPGATVEPAGTQVAPHAWSRRRKELAPISSISGAPQPLRGVLRRTPLYVTPLDRVTEFGGELHEDGGKLFCTSCSVVLNHVRKSTISDHLKSKTHTKRKAEFEEQNVRKKQRPLTASLQCNSTAQTEKVSVIQDFVKKCLEANIPLEKADHPAVHAFLSRHVKNGGSIPKSDQLRRAYLPDGYENENQLLNSQDC